MTDLDDLKAKLAELKQKHRDLDAALDALTDNIAANQLQAARLKKEKLRLKDMIAKLEGMVIPNIIA